MRGGLEVCDFGGIGDTAFERVRAERAERDGAGAKEAACGPVC